MLDEPLGALDRMWRTRLLGEIRTLLDRAALPALYVTHDHHEAFTIAGRVALVRDGRIVQTGAPAAVWHRPVDAWVATFLGFGPAVEGELRAGALHTPWGVVPAPAGSVVEGPVDVIPRPDAARLDPRGGFSGSVARVEFGGATIDVAVEPAAGPPVVVSVAADAAPGVHDAVRWSFDHTGLLVWSRTAD